MTSAQLVDVRGLREARARTLHDFVASSGLQPLVLGTSKDPNAKVTILLVDATRRAPVLAVKAPTTEAAERAVQHELSVLADVHARVPGELALTIPRVVDTVSFEGRVTAVATALQGRPMTTVYLAGRHTSRRREVASDFAAVATWLERFQRATAGALGPLEMDCGVSDALRRRFGGDVLERDLERLAETYDRLRRNSVRRTVVHGDFWLGNALIDRGRVSGVVDWEAAAMSGEPTRDLVRFAHMYALYLDRRTRPGKRVAGHPGLCANEWGAGVRYALDGDGWFPYLFREFVGNGLARLGASRLSWRDAAVAGIAEVAAFTDDDEFARRHLELFRRVAGSGQR
jgi:aminoglycoside phosphotransferase (APT) family kinase protein